MNASISEIFESIQGEGPYVGERHLFVRFSGCNLECRYCDTKHAGGRRYSSDELFAALQDFKTGYRAISFTGGEPLLHKDFLKEILPRVQAPGVKRYLETNGTLPAALSEVIEWIDIVAMDLKLPGSTGLPAFWEAHEAFLKISTRKEVFLKAVICNGTQERDMLQALSLLKKFSGPPLLVLQPNSFEEGAELKSKTERFCRLCLNEGVTARIIPQMHKLMGVR